MNDQQKLLTPRLVAMLFLVIVVVPFLPLVISGRWDWWEAWVYAAVAILGFVISRWLAAQRHPDLLAERARTTEHENTVSWDRVLSPLVGLGSGLIPLIAGVNERLDPSATFSLPVKIGALLAYLATPVFLDAPWAFVPAVLVLVAMVIRTRLEDGWLQERLAGYRDYAGRVRYRLIPGVW